MINDTICAQATAVGTGGISIIRVSGPDALRISRKIFRYKKKEMAPRFMYLVDIYEKDRFIDKALGVFFKAPFSYTGEDVFEFHCHGGIMVSKLVLRLLIENGARPAEPGEFTKRAFLNGKIDMSEAEAISDQISASSDEAVRNAALQLRGDLKKRIFETQDNLTDILSEIEAGIEYPEEDLEPVISVNIAPKIVKMAEDISELAESFNKGKLLKEGTRVAIVGKPNVGKSSLMNAFFGEDKAIVSSIPGTTRDIITDSFVYRSLLIHFFDTAGIRDTNDEIETIGVRKSLSAISNANICLLVFDSSEKLTDEDRDIIQYVKNSNVSPIIVLNKSDLTEKLDDNTLRELIEGPVIKISAKDRTGIENVFEAIFENITSSYTAQEGVVITNQRQYYALINAKRALNDALKELEEYLDLDLVAIDLKDAWMYLGEITGNTLNESIIDRIFEKFCLGK